MRKERGGVGIIKREKNTQTLIVVIQQPKMKYSKKYMIERMNMTLNLSTTGTLGTTVSTTSTCLMSRLALEELGSEEPVSTTSVVSKSRFGASMQVFSGSIIVSDSIFLNKRRRRKKEERKKEKDSLFAVQVFCSFEKKIHSLFFDF